MQRARLRFVIETVCFVLSLTQKVVKEPLRLTIEELEVRKIELELDVLNLFLVLFRSFN